MKKNIAQLILAIEEDCTGVLNVETEYVFYAKLSDASILDTATKVEGQEQWSIKVDKSSSNKSQGSVRIRKTTEDNKTSYVLTIKTPVEALQDVLKQSDTQVTSVSQNMREVAIEATEDAFNLFKLLSSSGMVKTRYCLPIKDTGLVFEVDRFLLPNGEYSNWVKIDLEVNTKLTDIPKLPDEFIEVIYNQKDKQTDEEKELIDSLYENIFLTKK